MMSSTSTTTASKEVRLFLNSLSSDYAKRGYKIHLDKYLQSVGYTNDVQDLLSKRPNPGYDATKDELSERVGHNEWSVSRFVDRLGRTTVAHRCYYCRKQMPVKVWSGVDFSSKIFKENYVVFMTQFKLNNGRVVWRCKDCASDISFYPSTTDRK